MTAPAPSSGPQPLGLNQGGYRGETIDIAAVLEEISEAARQRGWSVESLPNEAGLSLLALHWQPAEAKRRYYISTGIHGDEPAGPLSVLRLLTGDPLPDDAEFWILPCLNPYGFTVNQRENAVGIDLNRDYQDLKSVEVRAHRAWLRDKGQFDCAMSLHEDWESSGFYLYALDPPEAVCVSRRIIEAVRSEFPIDPSEIIEGMPAVDGVIHPPLDPEVRDIWPESLYLLEHHGSLGYTIESASDYPLESRVKALELAVRTVLQWVSEGTAASSQSRK